MKSVFLVDDSMFIITQLGQILEKGGYRVIDYAVSGKEALEKFSRLAQEIDIVTLDITMPDHDGIVLLRKMRDIKPETQFIMISAIGKKQAVLESRELGATGYIIKPLTRDKVLERMRQLLS